MSSRGIVRAHCEPVRPTYRSSLVAAIAMALGVASTAWAEAPAEPATRPVDVLSAEHATDSLFDGRSWLGDRGISLDLDLVVDYSRNLRGGLRRGDAFRYLFNLGITLETEPLLGWEGGTFFFGAQTHHGRNGSERLTGDLQGFDNIDSEGFTQISEVWYEQKLLDEKVRVKVGKVDANSEFAYVENGAEFLNSSAGVSPTVLGLPTYPDPATSVNVFVYPHEWFYAGAGLYDGATQDGGFGRTGDRGPATFWGDPADLFLIGEAGVKWKLAEGRLPGRLGVGAWHHTGTFDRFDGGQESGTSGLYAVLDQRLWNENAGEPDDQGIGLFVQLGQADPNVGEFGNHIGVGATWTGAIPSRDADVLGLMVSRVGLSGEPGAGFRDSSETAIEAFYKVQITPWLSVKPDLQCILNAGGTGEGDALVMSVRVEMAL